jgi:hypothetical protein
MFGSCCCFFLLSPSPLLRHHALPFFHCLCLLVLSRSLVSLVLFLTYVITSPVIPSSYLPSYWYTLTQLMRMFHERLHLQNGACQSGESVLTSCIATLPRASLVGLVFTFISFVCSLASSVASHASLLSRPGIGVVDAQFAPASDGLKQVGLVAGIIAPSLYLVAVGLLAAVRYRRYALGLASVIVFVGNILPGDLMQVTISAYTELAYMCVVCREVRMWAFAHLPTSQMDPAALLADDRDAASASAYVRM